MSGHRSNSSPPDFDSALESFQAAAGGILERRALQRRAETKFVLPVDSISGILGKLAGKYHLLHAGTSRIATYETLYFDTEDLTLFHAHRRGCRVRQKVRIRHYPERGVGFLEVKKRHNEMLTVKIRARRECGDNRLRDEDIALLRDHVGVSGPLAPRVWTNCRRITLIGVETEERVTVDYDLLFKDDRNSIHLAKVGVVEIKQNFLRHDSPVMLVLRNRGYRPGRFSKYCTAVVALFPEIRHNRLKPALRQIERISNG